MSMGKKLRAPMRDGKHHFTPGITTPLHAMIAEKAGFEFTYMGGYDVSLTLLGLPDVGLITGPEMVANAGNIARSVNIPVIADADTGYGNAINVIRTVRDFEAAGVAAIHIEDQVSPKRCGHVAGKMVFTNRLARCSCRWPLMFCTVMRLPMLLPSLAAPSAPPFSLPRACKSDTRFFSRLFTRVDFTPFNRYPNSALESVMQVTFSIAITFAVRLLNVSTNAASPKKSPLYILFTSFSLKSSVSMVILQQPDVTT